MKTTSFCCTLLLLVCIPTFTLACTGPPPDPPPKIWVIPNGNNEFWVGIEISLFVPPGPTNCACGIGFSNPGSISVLGAAAGVTNTRTHQTNFIPEFDFQFNPTTTNGLNNNFPSGGLWTGFHGLVDPFSPPQLGPDEVFKLWFLVEAPGGLPLTNVLFAGGTSDGNGNIDNPDDPSHPVETWTAVNASIPEPTTFTLVGLGFLAVATTRRRKK